jgi:glycosyltransferase involved in cell wall biosynthesis
VKITIFTQYYDPEPCAAAKRTTATARKFASSGFAVDIVTGFPNFPDGRIPKKYRGKLFSLDRDGSVSVTRVWTFASTNRRGLYRAFNWISVALGSIVLACLRIRSCDAIYVSIPPITLAFPALIASYVSGAPLFVDVRDAYPEVAINLGVWKRDSTIAKIVSAIADLTYRRARTIFCATEGVRDAVVERCSPGKDVQVVTNGFDRTRPDDTSFAREAGEFVAAYAGNMGLVSGLDVVLDAAALLRDDRRIRFRLVGGGSESEALRERVRTENLANVEFAGVVAAPLALAALRDADVALVPLKRQIVDCLPSKMFDALSVGCPLMLSGDGEAKRFLERAGGGWCVPPEDPAALADALRQAASDRKACRARGKSGRDFVLANYDRDRIVSGVVRSVFAATSPLPHQPAYGDVA